MRAISVSTAARADAAIPWRGMRSGGWGLAVSAVALAVVGLATVSSASSELGGSTATRQLVWVLLGVVLLALGAVIDGKLLLRAALPVYAVGIGAVALVTFFGHEAGGARSWIGVAGFGGQPSDFAKLGTALLLARYLGGLRQLHLDLRHLLVAGLIVAVPMSLIAMQPDLGGAAMFVPLYLGMVLVAGVRGRLIVAVVLVALAVGGAVWSFGLRDYQRDRIATFVSPDRDPLGAGYQVRQSKIAVGSGALLGKGYGQGTQSQLRFLPARHTDFVFAVLAEEWGFVGVSAVLGLYALFLGAGLRIATRARNRAGVLLAAGLLAALAAHVLYNTGMMIGLVPVTGIPLPFLSYGGSFMLFCFFVTGLLLGIDLRRYVNRF
jgi:rod shape determining protein RodA